MVSMTQIDALGNAHKSAGSPGGGQFTSKTTSAPTVALSNDKIREATNTIERSARALVNSYRLDSDTADDIVQDTWVHLLDRNSRHGDIEKRASERQFLTLATKTLGTRYGEGSRFGLRSEDYKARRMLQEREAAFETDNGRKMSNSERRAAAEDIRMNGFKAGSRPKSDFHLQMSLNSLDAPAGEDRTLGDVVAETHLDGTDVEYDEQERRASHALLAMAEGNGTKNDARKEIWNIVSIRSGAPKVTPGTLNRKQAAHVRRVVENAGGATALAHRWEDGKASEDEEAALFAPFNRGAGLIAADRDAKARAGEDVSGIDVPADLTTTDKLRVVDLMDEYPSMADRIWAAGLSAAAS